MKYYVYVSDSKVDMLLAQIPQDQWKKIALEAKVNLSVFSIKGKVELETGKNRYERVRAVVEALSLAGEIGTMDEPQEYFRGEVPMVWQERVCVHGSTFPPRPAEELRKRTTVLFAAENERTIVALGGSLRHVIGTAPEQPKDEEDRIGSGTPSLLWAFETVTNVDLVNDRDGKPREVSQDEGAKQMTHFADRLDLGIVAKGAKRIFANGVSERMEFIAKTLVVGEVGGKRVLLGSPLYVCLAKNSFDSTKAP